MFQPALILILTLIIEFLQTHAAPVQYSFETSPVLFAASPHAPRQPGAGTASWRAAAEIFL